MAGRPRKPTAILELTGAFKKDPQRKRARANEPKPNGEIGAPPAYFDDDHAAIWYEYVDETAPGVLTKADRKLLEVATRITRKMRVAPGKLNRWLSFFGRALVELGMPETEVEEFRSVMRAGLGVSPQELSLLTSCFTRMGMTPADRSRVHVAKPKVEEEADPLDELEAKIGNGRRPN